MPDATENNPSVLQSTNDLLRRGNVSLDSVQFPVTGIVPSQFVLLLQGSLPTPCNQLRIAMNPPDAGNNFQADVYSVVDSDLVCAQVLVPLKTCIPIGSFTTGHYTIWVNGKQIGGFDS